MSIASRDVIDLNERSTRLEKDHPESDQEETKERPLVHRDVNDYEEAWLGNDGDDTADVSSRKLQPCKSEVVKNSG